MSDMSLGPILAEQFKQMDLPDNISIDDDFNFGPIAIVQRFQATPNLCERIVFFSAVVHDYEPGTIAAYRWQGIKQPVEEVQQHVNEAVTGVVSLENLLVIGEHFGIWPNEVFVVEVEPKINQWGEEFSDAVSDQLNNIIAIVRRAAIEGKV